jgi:hypothetical protein
MPELATSRAQIDTSRNGRDAGSFPDVRRAAVDLPDRLANPAPLGLMAFGLTTILLNVHNAGLTELDTMILAMGVFYGGIAQLIAGLVEFGKRNTFGATAFCSYGLFWLSLIALLVFPEWGLGDAPSAGALGGYLFVWGVFTALMFVGSLRTSRALQAVFAALALLFFLLALSEWTGSETLRTIAGWEGLVTGALAVYAATAQIWNEVYGRVVLPLGATPSRPRRRR